MRWDDIKPESLQQKSLVSHRNRSSGFLCRHLPVRFVQHQMLRTFGKLFHKTLVDWFVYDVLR